MKAWDICKKENVGKVYKDGDGNDWGVVCIFVNGIYDLLNNNSKFLSYSKFISQIAEMEFTEVEKEIDWSKVAVDTNILVKGKEDSGWNRRHFAKCENGAVYAWNNGKTSFTAVSKENYSDWEYAKLYEGEE